MGTRRQITWLNSEKQMEFPMTSAKSPAGRAEGEAVFDISDPLEKERNTVNFQIVFGSKHSKWKEGIKRRLLERVLGSYGSPSLIIYSLATKSSI